MKTKEELIALKEEVEALNRKLGELNEDELTEVVGGITRISEEQGLSKRRPYGFSAFLTQCDTGRPDPAK